MVDRSRRLVRDDWIDPTKCALPCCRARHPSIHRPSRPARGAGPAGRPGRQPAVVLAPADPGRLRARWTPTLWESTGHDPVRLLGAVEPDRLERAGRRTTASSQRLGAAARRPRALPDRGPLVPAHGRRGDDGPARSPTSRRSSASPPCCRSTPAASASSPATTSRPPATSASRSSASACSTGTGYFKQSLSREGWQQETYPVLDPDELPISLLREADGTRATVAHRPARRAPTWSPGSGSPSVGRVPLLLLDSDVEGNPDHYRERHRPALRRHQRAPAAPGAAARRRRRPRAARLLAGSPAPRRPRCSTPTRATPASSASSGSAS